MQIVRLTAFFLLVCMGWCGTAKGDWRPCGPGNPWGGNRCISQGFYGADFRCACARHDACYDAGCCRRNCDRQFLCDMNDACECSEHPHKCRCKARCYYCMARLFGGCTRRNRQCCDTGCY